MKRILIPLALMTAGLSACSQEEAAKETPVRPVLSIIAAPRAPASSGFTGTVEAKFSTDLGFQVLGRITARHVNVGDLVREGQVLADLDATSLQLAVNQAQADLASAEAKLDLAKVNEQRQKTLVQSAAGTREQLEEALQLREAADATVQQLQASLSKVEEQLSYASLRANSDGVVSAVAAEVGQVVSAGQTVMTIARLDARDAVVDIPDSYATLTAIGSAFEIYLQAEPETKVIGTVREASPQADAATRTRRTKIALQSPPEGFRLGSTVTAAPVLPNDGSIWLPQTAVGGKDGEAFVWVVDTNTRTVSRRTVTTRPSFNGGIEVLSGLEKGERVVTAGVNSLADNQSVRFADEMPL